MGALQHVYTDTAEKQVLVYSLRVFVYRRISEKRENKCTFWRQTKKNIMGICRLTTKLKHKRKGYIDKIDDY